MLSVRPRGSVFALPPFRLLPRPAKLSYVQALRPPFRQIDHGSCVSRRESKGSKHSVARRHVFFFFERRTQACLDHAKVGALYYNTDINMA